MTSYSGDLIQLDLTQPSFVQAAARSGPFDIETFLEEERGKDLLRFSTAGSVDDGKSTLIGRLLYDTQNVYDDQVRSIEGKGSAGEGQLDLALLTDGLRAEREQGITIDVAYRYFATRRRKFIIADTPGHEQYTRNMATGASTADVAIVLVDARKGVLVQSRRHAYIAALLGVPQVIVAINKMDLVDYAEDRYLRIREEFTEFFASLEEHGSSALHFVPVSALAGDNVARCSAHMPWYGGPTLLELLESIPSVESAAAAPFRFAVQRVLRPNQNFRGFAGQISAGTVRPGDAVMVLPSGRKANVRSIVTFDGDLAEAAAPLSVCLTLDDEIDISRGDMLAAPDRPASVARSFTASLVWMDAQPLVLGRRYLLKHTSRTVYGTVRAVRYSMDVAVLQRTGERTGNRGDAATLGMNGIGLVEIETAQPLVLDLYTANRHTGSFVLIDTETNATAAAGMVRELLPNSLPDALTVAPTASLLLTAPVTPEDRVRRWGHRGAHVALTGSAEFADAVERALFERGAVVFRCSADDTRLQQAFVERGAVVLTHMPAEPTDLERIEVRIEIHSEDQATVTVTDATGSPIDAAQAVLALLFTSGILRIADASPAAHLQGENQ
jgi:sulfate adenylyltransferase large subunit